MTTPADEQMEIQALTVDALPEYVAQVEALNRYLQAITQIKINRAHLRHLIEHQFKFQRHAAPSVLLKIDLSVALAFCSCQA